MKKHGEHHKKIAEALKKAAKAHEEAHKHLSKLHGKQSRTDREHESEGMKAKMDRSAAQKKALKGKSAKKKREIIGGEKANIKLRKERKDRKK